MKSNPVLEQVIRLSEQWNSVVQETPDTRLYCWLGCSSQEQKMVKAFVMLQMSDQSNLNDIFLMSQQSFESPDTYGKSIIGVINTYINTWNEDEKLTEVTGKIEYTVEHNPQKSDIENFINNINNLAEILSCDNETKLIIALFPKSVNDFKEFKGWIDEMLKYKIEEGVRFMLYDSYDSRLFDSLKEKHTVLFKYIQPDIDLNGAINQVLENAKQEAPDDSSKDIISFQQLIVKMNEAIGYRKESNALKYGKQAIELSKKNKLPNLEALVYYFLYSFYSVTKKTGKAEEAIDNAIKYAKQSVEESIEGGVSACVQYLIVKANSYFFQNQLKPAIQYYSEALSMNSMKEGNFNIQINLYQMLGMCKRKRGDYDAWEYFVEGWKLIESLNKKQILSNQQYMYYADEMLKVKDSEKHNYETIFCNLWGDDWQDKMKKQHEKERDSLKILK